MMFLLDTAIKSSLLLLLAFFAAWLLRKASAATRHFVLAAGLVCAAVSPALTLVVPAWRLDLPVPVPARESSQPAATSRMSTETVVDTSPVAVAPSAISQTPARRPLFTAEQLFVFWGAGIAVALLSLLAGFARLRWIARRASPVTHQEWLVVLADVAARHGLVRMPRLLQSRHPSLMVTWGAMQPTVLLPGSAPEWSLERMRVVLDHELAHIARRDWVTQIGAEILRCVYWFNPLMWVACRRLRQESEQACDDRVLGMGHAGPEYAAHLLELARAFRSSDRVWIPAAAIARPSSLERRVAAMLTNDVNREPVSPRVALAAVLLLVATMLPIASFDAFAQTRFAAVSGAVTDESGAMLVDAVLTLTNSQTSAKHELRTNQTGFYEFVGLPAGTYDMQVRRPGFEAGKERLSLGVGEVLQRDVRLRVGSVQEVIAVFAGETPRPFVWPPRGVTGAPRPCPDPAVGGCIGPPRKLKDVRPDYPPALENSGIEGEVVIEGIIGTDGRMKDMRVIESPHPELERAALDAVGEWEFTPTTLNGRTIETRISVSVGFGLAPRAPIR